MEAAQGRPLIYVVDTSVLSQTVKPHADASVMRWWRQRPVSELCISAITIHELRYGFELLPAGKKRQLLEAWLALKVLPAFAGRIFPLDEAVADMSGRMLAEAKRSGHTAEVADAMIAATARLRGARLATLNRKHFAPFKSDMVSF